MMSHQTEPLPGGWLQISAEGFASENRNRHPPLLVKELIQNSLDAIGSKGEIKIRFKYPDPNTLEITVEDNGLGISRENLPNLRTIFWTSKQDSHSSRGRMGRGFKECLSIAVKAEVHSGNSKLVFHRNGNTEETAIHELSTPQIGTLVHMWMPWKASEIFQILLHLHSFLLPKTVRFTIEDAVLPYRKPRYTTHASLPTDVFEKGAWVRKLQNTEIQIFECSEIVVEGKVIGKEPPLIYEMGIPICSVEWKFPFHINVLQRVPMNAKRDTVASGYPTELHKAALPTLVPLLDTHDVLGNTVGTVIEHLPKNIQKQIIERGFGKKCALEVPITDTIDNNEIAKELGFLTIDPNMLSGNMRAVLANHLQTTEEAVANHEEEHYKQVQKQSFTLENWKNTNIKTQLQRRLAIHQNGGPERIALVIKFATWFTQNLLSIYPTKSLQAVNLALFLPRENNTQPLAAWSPHDNQLTLGLNHPTFFKNPLSPQSFSTLIHEAAHMMQAHHGPAFYKEIEKLSGRATHILMFEADTIKTHFGALLEFTTQETVISPNQ